MKNLMIFMVLLQLHSSIYAQDKDSVVTLPTVIITSNTMISSEVDKSFLNKFPNADDIVWSRLNKDYLAKFIQDDLKHQSLFKKNGYMKYDIAYMTEDQLPSEIRRQVVNGYDGFKISNAAKILRLNQEFWIINLEGINNYIVLRAENGAIDEVRRYRKS